MAKLQVSSGAWVVICRGKRALFLHNEGDHELLNLRRISVRERDNPATRDQGSGAPGKASSTGGRAGSMEQTDWHMIEEQRFADTVAEELNKASREHAFKELVVVAPPKILAELRREFSKEIGDKIAVEIPKDLTHHTIPEIEKLLGSYEA